MKMKLKFFYLGTEERKYEFTNKQGEVVKGTSIKVKTAFMDGTGRVVSWKVKEANHALQEKLAKIPPMSMVTTTNELDSVKDEAVIILSDIEVTK